MINRLDGFRPPTEVPEKIKKSYRDYEEIERSYRWTFKLRQWIVKASSKVGIWITGGFLAPILLVASLRREFRARRAHRYAKLGDKFLNNGMATLAVPLLRRAVKLSPEIPHFWHDYAVALAQTGKTDKAVKAHRQATEKGAGFVDEPQFWYGLGYTLWRAGRDEEALEAFDRVLEIAPPGSLEYTEAKRGREYCLSNLGRRSRV
jgi:tetratricopeptide (TPR) repeat protein